MSTSEHAVTIATIDTAMTKVKYVIVRFMFLMYLEV